MKLTDKKAFEQVNIFGTGAENTEYAQYFSGASFLNPLTNPEKTVFLANVTFEPGCGTTGIFTMQSPVAVSF